MHIVLSPEKVSSGKHNTIRLICAHFSLFREILVEKADKATWDYMEKRQERLQLLSFTAVFYMSGILRNNLRFQQKEKIIQRRSQFVAYFDLWCFEFRFP